MNPTSSASDTGLNEILTSSAHGATFLVFIQVVSRGLTFVANQVVLRHLCPEVLGVAAQLELYLITTLYFSRESIRAAIQRQPSITTTTTSTTTTTAKSTTSKTGAESSNDATYDPSHRSAASSAQNKSETSPSVASQTVINMAYLSLGIGFPLVVLFAFVYFHFAKEEVIQTPYFQDSLRITGLACLLELMAEPFFAVVQHHMLYKTRAVVETLAAVAKSFTMCAASIWGAWAGRDVGVLPFAIGSLVYSCALVFCYFLTMGWQSRERTFSFLLSPIRPRGGSTEYWVNRFSKKLVRFGASAYFQSIAKHLLTQGDSMILVAMSTLEDQGIYMLVSNYGGLIARVLFQPIEETSRNLFARLVNRQETIDEHDKTGVNAAKAHLVDMLRMYGILSVLIFSLAPSLVPTALHILIGSRWSLSKVDSLLSVYCYYIPFLAFNGITEAFVASVASSSEMRKQTAWMGTFSACFAGISYLFLQLGDLGAYGLILANIINMTVRTTWSYLFIRSYLRRHGSNLSLPEIGLKAETYAACGLALSIMSVAGRPATEKLQEVAKKFGLGFLCTALILYLERELLIKQYMKIRGMKFDNHRTSKSKQA